MPAYTQPNLRGFHIVFERDGRELEAQHAPTGERALRVALVMLAHLEFLQDGDRLIVTERR
jgi:hypothetical protein